MVLIPTTRGNPQASDVAVESTLPVLAAKSRQDLDTSLLAINANLNVPLRLSASFPTPDSKLNINANTTIAGDGGGQTTSPIDDITQLFASTTIDFQSGAVVPSGNALISGNTFVLPPSVTGMFKRVAIILRSDSKLDLGFSADAASYGALPDVATLFDNLNGTPIGFIDIVGTATSTPGAFKTASSAGSSATAIIENSISSAPAIFRYSAGAGGGAGGDTSFKIQAVNTPNALLKGGYVVIERMNKELATYTGSGTTSLSFGKDLTLNLSTILGSAPANATTYYLYIDLDSLPLTPITTSDSGRILYPVVQSNFVLLLTAPEQTNRGRYVPIGLVKSATTGNVWSGAGAGLATYGKMKYDNGPLSINPTVYTKSLAAVGELGDVGQSKAGHKFDAKSFPKAMASSKRSHWLVEADGSDQSGNARTLAVGTDVTFNQTNIFGETNKAALGVAGVNSGFKNDTHIDFTDGDSSKSYMMCGWFNSSVWNSGSTYVMALGSGANSLFIFDQQGSGIFRFRTEGAVETKQTFIHHGFADNTWHFMVMYYDAVSFTGKLFIDGGQVVNHVHTAGPVAWTAGGAFYGIDVSNSSPFLGPIYDLGFTKGQELTNDDIKKLYASRLDHMRNVLPSNQEWSTNIYSGDIATQPDTAWLVDKNDKDTLFLNLSDMAPTDSYELFLKDTGFSSSVIPVTNLRRIFSSDPGSVLAHGLPETPSHVEIWKEISPDQWEVQNGNGLVSADATNLYLNLSSLAPIDGSHRVKIIASSGDSAVAFDETSFGDGSVPAVVKLSYATAINASPGAGQFRSAITNRAPLVDMLNDLSSRQGTERIRLQTLVPCLGEYGPNGEPVFKSPNDERVRFGGQWVQIDFGDSGVFQYSFEVGDFVEVTFMGTGLTFNQYLDGTARTYDIYTDSNSVTSTVTTPATSDVFVGQGLTASHSFNVVKGLTYGLHTVRMVATGTPQFSIYSVDILNESTSVKTSQGVAVVNGLKRTLFAPQSTPYNSGFINQYGTPGIRGGRVLQYLDKNGVMQKDVRWVDTQLTGSSTDHSNEEVIRSYHIREFGGSNNFYGRDVASLGTTSSDRTFALDDGTTVLTLANCPINPAGHANREVITQGNASNIIYFTFVGTGLDLILDAVGGSTNGQVVIDGVTTVTFGPFTARHVRKVISGLAYRQHTATITYASGAGSLGTEKFIVYGPKAPSLPTGAVAISEYNIMEDYLFVDDAGWLNGGNMKSSHGTVFKSPLRDSVYFGSWNFSGVSSATDWKSGILVQTATSGDYVEFECTASNIEMYTTVTASHDIIVYLDGALYTGAATLSSGSSTWTPGTSTWANNDPGTGSKLAISGLSFGSHKVRLVLNVVAGSSSFGGWAVTPLTHVHKELGPSIQENALSVGAQGIRDIRSLGDQVKKPLNSSTTLGGNGHNLTSTTFIPISQMTTAIYSETGIIEIEFQCVHQGAASSGNIYFQYLVDGLVDPFSKRDRTVDFVSSSNKVFNWTSKVVCGKGWHTVQVQGRVGAGAVNIGVNGDKMLTVKELANA